MSLFANYRLEEKNVLTSSEVKLSIHSFINSVVFEQTSSILEGLLVYVQYGGWPNKNKTKEIIKKITAK